MLPDCKFLRQIQIEIHQTGTDNRIAASIAVALALNMVFAQTGSGANRELLEGVTGLLAAAMLVSMSYWLHSKASLGAWQNYIREQSSAALATGRVVSLALVAANRGRDIIEDLMIAANGVTARFLEERMFASLRRIVRTHFSRSSCV